MNSPFIDQISDCKKRMRKLRKKIYKHTIAQHQKKPSAKTNDLSSMILNIFNKRSVPQTIISSLKNKRNIDIFSLKSLVIGNEQELKWDLSALSTRTSKQQEEVQKMYKQHRERMYEAKKLQTPRMNRRPFTTSNYVSSTQGDFSSNSSELYSQESDPISNNNNDCSQFDERDEQYQNHDHSRFDNHSLQENIFAEVMLERKQRCSKLHAQAFSSFEMDESSILQEQNIFNF